ncbi:MAG: glycosyltransferase family 4 protein [Chloroflexi bacterium]|nr:glycosyltransferase family 4 protein [Chloroflexota bacterium]
MMHVGLNAHLHSARAGYRSAGIHGYIDGLLRHLPAAAAGDPRDWAFSAFVGSANPLAIDGVAVRQSRLDTEPPPRRILWEQTLQPWLLGDFDLYHALAFVAPLLLTTPSVVTVYDLSFMHYPRVLSPARRLYLRLFTALSCRRARRVIAISHSTARDLTATLNIPADKIDVAAPGCDFGFFRPLPPETIAAFRRAHDLPERYWLFVGTLEPRKNLPTLLAAYAALPPAERLPLIIGGGKGWDYEPIFAAVDDYDLGNTVQFVGFISPELLPLWYNGAQSFVYPSVFEGFGLPVLEAMACGTPVIAAATSSLPEVVGAAGLTVPPHDTGAWTEALRRSHDAAWRDSARAQGLSAAQRYTWAETARQTLLSYRRAVGMSDNR